MDKGLVKEEGVLVKMENDVFSWKCRLGREKMWPECKGRKCVMARKSKEW